MASADGVAVRERTGCGVPVGDTERVGVGVGVGVVVGRVVVRVGSGEIDGCPVVEELPAGAVGGGGLTST
ncbi:MAG: hypothetical protein WBF34_04260 [Streptosporangiaceae bacterium]